MDLVGGVPEDLLTLSFSYHIVVIDLMKNPRLAKDDQIVAVPTLLTKLLKPLRRIIGDLSDAGAAAGRP